jgi:hypothetical protein
MEIDFLWTKVKDWKCYHKGKIKKMYVDWIYLAQDMRQWQHVWICNEPSGSTEGKIFPG